MKGDTLGRLRSGLVVSCQAHGGHPLRDPSIIGALAESAVLGGAAGIRADGPEDIAEIKKRVSVPVIGINKVPLDGERFSITPTFDHARTVVRAGADIVALEATFENRPDDEDLEALIQRTREVLGVPVMADVSVFAEGRRAWELGADLLGTTLSGYTRESLGAEAPDLGLVEELSSSGMRVACEGRVGTPEHAAAALRRGAWCVVVGTAITDPVSITAGFVEGLEGGVKP
jgi:N-acylglucosamine-6-phosphate 2-epimerase